MTSASVAATANRLSDDFAEAGGILAYFGWLIAGEGGQFAGRNVARDQNRMRAVMELGDAETAEAITRLAVREMGNPDAVYDGVRSWRKRNRPSRAADVEILRKADGTWVLAVWGYELDPVQ